MKKLLNLEEIALLALAVFFNTYLPYAWWWYWVWFLVPDVSMLGYVMNARVGAFTYNFFHHQAVAIACFASGFYLHNHELQFVGLVLLGHSAADRALGYGLKYGDSFRNTHLGPIGRQ